MTSKTSCNNSISYRKYILENVKQRGWLAVLSLITIFFVQTVHITINIENFLNTSAKQDVSFYREQFPHMLNGNYITYLTLVIIFLAVVCAVSGYAYLHQPEKSDFFHGFPLKRTQWFHISYMGGLLIFLIPYLLSSLCTMVIAAVKGILVSSNLTASVLAVFAGILGFLVLYHTAVLAMMLTGKLISGTLAALVLIVYGSMVTQLFSGLISRFLDTHYSNPQSLTSLTSTLSNYWSPMALYRTLTYKTVVMYKLPSFLLITVLIIAALWLSARYLCQIRPLESAGNALAYPKTASVIKVLIAIPAALSFGLFADSFYYNVGNNWIVFFSILAVILLCGIIEFIYTQDLRQIFQRKYSSLISIAGVIGILSVMHFDLFGYDTWLPEHDKVESIALYSDSYMSYFEYPDTISEIDTDYREKDPIYYSLQTDNVQCKNFDSIYTLAEEGIQNHNMGITSSVSYTDGMEDYISIVIRFNKTNGKSVYRSYAVTKDSLTDCLDDLCQDKSYRQALFPVFHLTDTKIQSITLNDILSNTPLDLTVEEQAALLKAYQTDTMYVDIHKLQEDNPIGNLMFGLKTKEDEAMPIVAVYPYDKYYNDPFMRIPLYDTYENTLDLLKKYGYSVRTSIDPEDVLTMVHTVHPAVTEDAYFNGIASSSDETETMTPITEPNEINRLLNRITFSPLGIAGNRIMTMEYVEIWLKGELSSRYFSLLPE